MAKVTFTDEDVNRSKTIEEPAWIPCEMVKYEEKSAKTDNSALYVYQWKALDEKHKGMVFYAQFSEKALGMMKNLVLATGRPFKPGSFDTESITKGTKLDVYVKLSEYKGQMKNEVADFRPFGSAGKSATK